MTANAYSFLSWLRRGLATAITAPPGAAARAHVTVQLNVAGTAVADGVTLAAPPVQHDVQLYGPGNIVGVDARAVVRTDPRPWITNFDPNYLVAIEFYDEDFPWRYSPDVLDPATGRLRPWLALVVLTEDEFADTGVLPGRPLPFIEVKDLATLPPPDQLGAWSHVHSNRTVTASDTEIVSNDMATVLPRLAAVLAENPDLACSRILCPRHLDPEEGYHAFLVPAFETGRLAGLGHDPAGAPGALASSWVDYANRTESGNLPYYYRWQFRTAPIGDFEYLVRLLKPRGVDARVGNRDMDVRQPGSGLPGIDDPALGGVLRLGGALKVPDKDLSQEELDEQTLYENWDQPYPHPFQKALAALINLSDDYAGQTVQAAHQALTTASDSFVTSQTVTPDDPDPLITPPLYGRWHALTSRLLTNPDGTPIDPDDNWVHELNLDPRFRVPAARGAGSCARTTRSTCRRRGISSGRSSRRTGGSEPPRSPVSSPSSTTVVSSSRCGWPPGVSCSSSPDRCSPGWSQTPRPPPRSASLPLSPLPPCPPPPQPGERPGRPRPRGRPPSPPFSPTASLPGRRCPRLCAGRPGRAPRSCAGFPSGPARARGTAGRSTPPARPWSSLGGTSCWTG